MHCWRATTVVCMQASRRWNQPTLSFRSLHKSVRCCHCCCCCHCCTCKPHYTTLHHAELLHNMHRANCINHWKKLQGSKQCKTPPALEPPSLHRLNISTMYWTLCPIPLHYSVQYLKHNFTVQSTIYCWTGDLQQDQERAGALRRQYFQPQLGSQLPSGALCVFSTLAS